ncbi:MAG: hypothetical protein Q7R49_01945 [Candidatus Daviesbacteria bacterium]|nr:hypothetical protein [Candidatus Daviesbacteria bacterium]
MLETIIGNVINIGNLNLEEPKPRNNLFDVEQVVTDDKWQQMLAELHDPLNISLAFIELGRAMKILYPDRNLGTTPNEWQKTKDYIGSHRLGLGETARVLSATKMTFDDADIQEDIKELTGLLWEDAPGLNLLLSTSDLVQYLELAPDLAILFPNKLELREGISAAFKNIDQALPERYRNTYTKVYYMAKARLISSQYKPEFSVRDWKKMQDELFRQKNIDEFCYMAACLKILAAEEAKITESGIEITMPQNKSDLIQVILALPELRKF